MDFQDRNVVVTGGTGALGTALVRKLISAGAWCTVPCLETRELDRFPFRGHERVHIVEGTDLTDEAAVQRLYAAAAGTAGKSGTGGEPRLWASIHIAGGFSMAPVEQTTRAEFVKQMQTNALSCFLCCREAVKAMRSAGGGGRIVNVAARPALEPRHGAGMVAYTTSKAAVAALTQALAEEVVKDGILVNAVVPSVLDTPANRASMPDADFSKWPKVEEVSESIAFLASPENAVTRGALATVYGKT